MKIVCVDKTIADRSELVRFLTSTFEGCRDAIGHLPAPSIVPISLQELFLNANCDIVAIGPAFPQDEAATAAASLRRALPSTPIFLFLQPATFSLNSIRRFADNVNDTFSLAEAPARIVHALCQTLLTLKTEKRGALVVATGVKGGVGTSTLSAALAHAANGFGQRGVVVDLNCDGALAQYLLAPHAHSVGYGQALNTNAPLDRETVRAIVESTPSGVPICPPPAGGDGVRERWLRDSECLEPSLSLFDELQHTYDVVIVDLAQCEGILAFSIQARADYRLLVTSNDPAAVQLLPPRIAASWTIPGHAKLGVVLNSITSRGLQKEQVLDFLYAFDRRTVDTIPLHTIPFDVAGSEWIGTGNTFFTESSLVTQRSLEVLFAAVKGMPPLADSPKTRRWREQIGAVLTFFTDTNESFTTNPRRLLALPEPEARVSFIGDSPSVRREPPSQSLDLPLREQNQTKTKPLTQTRESILFQFDKPIPLETRKTTELEQGSTFGELRPW